MEPVHSVLLPVSGCASLREGMRLFPLLSCSSNFWGQAKEFFIFFFPYLLAADIESLLVAGSTCVFPCCIRGQWFSVVAWRDQLWGHLGLPWLKDLVPLGEELRLWSVLLVNAAWDTVTIAYCELLLFFWCLCPGDLDSYCWLTMYENSISKCKHQLLKSLMQRAHCRVNRS